jgi:hypothetical protein
VIQLVSLLGALTILLAYAANQFGRLRTTSFAYSVSNALGAGILTVVAAVEEQWGFLLLEGVWTLVSLAALAQLVRPSAVRDRPG